MTETRPDELEEERLDAFLERQPKTEARLRRWVTTGVAVAMLLTALLGFLAWRMARRAANQADEVAHSIQVTNTLELTLRHLDDVETGVRGFCIAGMEQFLEPYESGRAAVQLDLQQLRVLTTGHLKQQQPLDELGRLTRRRLDAAKVMVAQRRISGKVPAGAELLKGKQIMDEIRALLAQMQAEEKLRLQRRIQRSWVSRHFTSSTIALGSALTIIFLAIAGLSMRREIRVAAKAQAEVRALNDDLERRVEQRTTALENEVAARQETEAKLRRSDDMFRRLLDGIKEYAIYRVDVEGRVATWNSGAQRINGYLAEEIIGKHISCFYTAADQSSDHPQESMKMAAESGRFEDEGLRVRKDGSTFWASDVISPISEEEGSLSGYSKVVRDITQHKLADENVKKQAALLDLALDAIVVLNADARILFWNRGAQRMYGWSAEEARGQRIHDLLQTAFPVSLATIEETLVGEGEWEGELRHRTRKGEEVFVTSRMSRLRDQQDGATETLEINRDITDRKRAEVALQQANARARFALEAARLGDWELDLNTMQATRSLIHAQIYGYESLDDEWSFHSFLDHVHPDDREGVRKNFRSSVSEGKPLEVECRIVRKDGKIRWIWACGDQYRDSSGTPAGKLFGIIEDVTERRLAVEALRESEERFQAMANGISQLAWMAEADGSIFWYNQRWYEYTGTTFAEMQGWGWQTVHHPDTLQAVMEQWKGAIGKGTTFDMEFPLRGADGGFRTFLTRGKPLRNAEGRVVRWLGTNTDISERKQAEERLEFQAGQLARSREDLEVQKLMLQSVLDSMVEGLVVVDQQGKFALWNPAAEKILGRGPADLSPAEWSAHYGAYLPDKVTPLPIDHHPLVRASRGEANSAEVFFRDPERNREIWIESNAAPLRDHNGQPCGAVVAFRDVTQRKADESEIRKLNEELEERIVHRTAQLESANHELEAFTYSVSHDLRAPLRHIRGFSTILLDDFGAVLPAEASAHLHRIGDAVIRMGLLVDSLLGLAKLGRQPLKVQPNNLNTIVEQVIAVLQPECAGREVKWRIAELPSVECDRVLVGQVFQNLLSNALKYSRGRSTAIIEVDSMRSEQGLATLYVRDNGAGFNMQYAQKLFEVFQRMHTEAEFEGTGVGLATVHRIVKKHGGRVWAEAETDRGATFFFTLGAEQPMNATPNAAAIGVAG